MNASEFYNCTTITMGKYIEPADPQLEIASAKSFAKAFALWFEFDSFDEERKWLSIRISYVNDIFFSEDILRTIKFFMQFHEYVYLTSYDGKRSVYDDSKQE